MESRSSLASRLKGFIVAKRYDLQRYRNSHPSERGRTAINILKAFPLYRANMDGPYAFKAAIAVQSIQNTIPFLAQLCASLRPSTSEPYAIETLVNPACQDRAETLSYQFASNGSDKSTLHDYHLFYASILQDPDSVQAILEIGLGSTSSDAPCNMGVNGKPGASLRAWREVCVNAEIYGADIDRSILFQEDRIHTFFVDQTDPSAFRALAEAVPPIFDLIIDDGLHAVDANLQTLIFALPRLKPQGWFVIEDIAPAAQPLWQVVASLLADHYQVHQIKAKNGHLFAVQRLTS